MNDLVLLASLYANRDPLKRIQVFELIPAAFSTLEQAIQAAKDHYWVNFAQGKAPQFRVYESSDPDGTTYALIEVSEGTSDMVMVALYKAIAGKYRWMQGPVPVSQSVVSGSVQIGNPTSSVPEARPLQGSRSGN